MEATSGIQYEPVPANWVHRTQNHIVVTINYRVNIFAYPSARGLEDNNFSIQDQRAAVEWVAENVRAFGGDTSKITLMGESAGAFLTEQSLFAYANDPIIRASASISGVAISAEGSLDFSGSNFTFVAKAMGCDFEDAQLELQCMRRVPMPRLENFIGQYQDNQTLVDPSQPALSFIRRADDGFVFSGSQYVEKYKTGDIAKIPNLLGTCAREFSALLPYNKIDGPPEDQVIATTLGYFVCPAHNTSVLHQEAGLTTYRYQWAGNFTNLAGGVSWLGAYHFSDLYAVFGTYLIATGEISELEIQTSERMQDLLYDYIVDPECLPSKGWPVYDTSAESGGQLVRFAADDKVMQIVDGYDVESPCHIPGVVYDTTP